MKLTWDNFFLVQYRDENGNGIHAVERPFKGPGSPVGVTITGGVPPIGRDFLASSAQLHYRKEGLQGIDGWGFITPVTRRSRFRTFVRKFKWWNDE
jgi:hypothetical protein